VLAKLRTGKQCMGSRTLFRELVHRELKFSSVEFVMRTSLSVLLTLCSGQNPRRFDSDGSKAEFEPLNRRRVRADIEGHSARFRHSSAGKGTTRVRSCALYTCQYS